MAGESERLAVNAAAFATGLAAGTFIVGVPTVIGSILAGASCGAAVVAWMAAAEALENCLNQQRRAQDVATLRRELDRLKREVEELKRRQPAR